MNLSEELQRLIDGGGDPLCHLASMAVQLKAAAQTLNTENKALIELLNEVDQAPDDPTVRDNVRNVCSYLAAKAKGEGR